MKKNLILGIVFLVCVVIDLKEAMERINHPSGYILNGWVLISLAVALLAASINQFARAVQK